jgi:hypothetical protein
MSNRIPAGEPPPRVVHYVEPSRPTATLVNPAEIAAHRRDLQARYDRWLTRRDALRRRDHAVRRVLLVIAVAIVIGLLVAGVLLYQAVTRPGHGTWFGLSGDLLGVHAWLGGAGRAGGSAPAAGVGR